MDQMLPNPATPGEALLMQQNNVMFHENCVRSQNEKVLYAAWKQADEENSYLTTLIKTLQTHMQELREELNALTEKNMQVNQQVPANANYFTDEDELAEGLTGDNMQ